MADAAYNIRHTTYRDLDRDRDLEDFFLLPERDRLRDALFFPAAASDLLALGVFPFSAPADGGAAVPAAAAAAAAVAAFGGVCDRERLRERFIFLTTDINMHQRQVSNRDDIAATKNFLPASFDKSHHDAFVSKFLCCC